MNWTNPIADSKMIIEEYMLADCSLFRNPPLDFSSVKQQVTTVFMEAWEKGNSVESAINTIIEDSVIVDSLKEQIRENFEFQKDHGMKCTEYKKELSVSSHANDRDAKLSEIDKKIGTEVEKKKAKLESFQKELEENNETYNASQLRIKTMRQRVKENLSDIGNTKGKNLLAEMNATVLEYCEVEKEQIYQADASEKIQARPSIIPRVNTKTAPIETKTITTVVEDSVEQKYRAKTYVSYEMKNQSKLSRFWRNIKKILGYEVFRTR